MKLADDPIGPQRATPSTVARITAQQKQVTRELGAMSETDTKPCLLCGKHLETVNKSWDHMQPMDGGEVQFIFTYGSKKFDKNVGATVYRAVICDECAEKHVPNMDEDFRRWLTG